MEETTKNTGRRGFASMDPTKQREIASKGGRAAQERGVAHRFTSEEAQRAGRRGGQSVSQNRAHMAEIGRKGGMARGSNENGQAGLRLQHMLNANGPNAADADTAPSGMA